MSVAQSDRSHFSPNLLTARNYPPRNQQMTLSMNSPKSPALVIVDPNVDHYESLVQGVYPGTEVVILDAAQDGVAQITQAIARHTALSGLPLSSLHVVSHGRSGEIQLGTSILNQQTLKQYAQQMQGWAKALAAHAEILLYGCQVAAGAIGQQFVRQISQLTGASIAASATLTGSSAQGGNWDLEYTTQGSTAPLAFRSQTLAAYPGVLAILLSETFREADVTEKPWRFGIGEGTTSAQPFLTARSTVPASVDGLPGAGAAIDAPGDGALRLTGVANNQAAFVVYDRPLSQDDGLTITFDSYAYGGNSFEGSNGDGISFFLIDGNNPVPITAAGAFGGSLGYAQKIFQGIPGIRGGYLGVGYDEFGNFSTSLESTTLQRPTPTGVNVPVRDSIAVRGSEASQYAFLGGTPTLDIGVDNPTATTRNAAQRRTRIDLSPVGVLTVRVDLNSDDDFADPGEVVINNLDVTPINGAVPSTFKLGFAGSTGSATNIHEVRNLVVRDFVPPEVIIPPGVVDPDPIDDNCQPGRNIKGKATADRLRGTIDSDTLVGFAGNDLLQGRGCNDRINAGRGNDRMFGNGGTDTLQGRQGNDRGFGQRGRDQLLGGLGNDYLDGGDDRDGLAGGRGFDTLRGGDGSDTLSGGLNTDRLFGNVGSDRLGGQQGGDRLSGGRGDDQLSGGLGNDFLNGEGEQDVLVGGRGRDTLRGGKDSDTLDGGLGNDRLSGGLSNDQLRGRQNNDVLRGNSGDDTLGGGLGNDRLGGNRKQDVVLGNRGNDALYGGGGSDTLNGGLGNDRLESNTQADRLIGGAGADRLIGGNGGDVMTGGVGRDRFIYRAAQNGVDQITDFQTSRRAIDLIDLRGIVSKTGYGAENRFNRYVRLRDSGSGTVVRVDFNGNTAGGFQALVTLNDVAVSSLSARAFLVS
ncbi:MAG TPA: DUF4347 domain-containing protein [Coleofasciculaceae cyanobacterium]